MKNHLLNVAQSTNNKIVNICAIAKNEEAYIEDWLYYHFKLNFDNIIIYDNNIIENRGRLKKVIDESNKLNDYMKEHTIIIDACNKLGFQIIAYNEYYKSGSFDWCAFIDIDEFITLKKWKDIKEMINDEHFKDVEAIQFPWLVIGDDDIIDVPDNYTYKGQLCKNITNEEERERAAEEWEKIPLYNRLFKEQETDYDRYNMKMIIRKGINEKLYHHVMNNYRKHKILTPIYEKINYSVMFNNNFMFKYEKKLFNNGYIRHYRTKTLREYLRSKMKNVSSATNLTNRTSFLSEYYFKINKETQKKKDYYKSHHIPLTCHIYKNENEINNKQQETTGKLIYLIDNKNNLSNKVITSYIIPLPFIIKHIDEIDYFELHL